LKISQKIAKKYIKNPEFYYIESHSLGPWLGLCETMSWAKSHLKLAERPSLAWLLTASLAQLLALGQSCNITI